MPMGYAGYAGDGDDVSLRADAPEFSYNPAAPMFTPFAPPAAPGDDGGAMASATLVAASDAAGFEMASHQYIGELHAEAPVFVPPATLSPNAAGDAPPAPPAPPAPLDLATHRFGEKRPHNPDHIRRTLLAGARDLAPRPNSQDQDRRPPRSAPLQLLGQRFPGVPDAQLHAALRESGGDYEAAASRLAIALASPDGADPLALVSPVASSLELWSS